MKISLIVTTILLTAQMAATAATVIFTNINMTTIASVSGQNFPYTIGTGPTTGTVNIRQLAGTPSTIVTGGNPDTMGFYPQQSAGDLTPMVFRFTFDASRNFTINQNETLEILEVNSFTLASGSWTELSQANVTTTGSGSNMTFRGVNQGPPFGTYSIAGVGSSFDFAITNFPGYGSYGSAISVDVGSDTAVVGPAVAISLGVRVQWASETGKNYQPQFSYDMNTWSNFGAVLAGTGQTMELFDAAQPDPKKFYRIQTQ